MTEVAEPGSSGLWHAALFHRDAAEFEAGACRFAEAGARVGAPVLLACAEPMLGRLRPRLDGLGDRVMWADMTGMGANPGRLISVISEFADQYRDSPVWCVHQAAWPSRTMEELREVLRHEVLLNLALARCPVRVLCPYDADLPGEMISCAEAAHPVITRDGRWEPSPGYRAGAGRVVPRECDRPLPAPPASAWTLEYHDDLSGMRRFVSAHAQAAGLPPHRADDLVIAAGELAANTLAHTEGPGLVMVWADDGEVICQVRDTGHIPSPLAGQLRPDPAAGGGSGLWLVQQLGDLVQIRSGPAGTIVRVHMRLAP